MLTRFKIFERKNYTNLYHYTSASNILSIILNDSLDELNSTGISLTRDKNFHNHNDGYISNQVRLTLDGEKISDNYKIRPYQYHYITNKDGITLKSKMERSS